MVSKNELQVDDIKKKMSKVLEPLEISYIEILSRDFQAQKSIEIGNSVVLVEALVGTTRLLDNIWL